MKLMMILLSAIYMAMAQPVLPLPTPPTSIVLDVLTQITKEVIALKFADVPTSITDLPPSQLTGCISPHQRALVKVCAESFSKAPAAVGKEFLPYVVECTLKGIEAYDPDTKSIDMINLKEGMIGLSTITTDQKKAAEKTLDDCLASTFPLPQKAVERGDTNLSKAMICSAKALALNGCADKAVRLTRMAQDFAGIDDDDEDESDEDELVNVRERRHRKGGRSRERHRGKPKPHHHHHHHHSHEKHKHSHEKHKHSHEHKHSHSQEDSSEDMSSTTTTTTTTTTTPSTTTSTTTTPSTTTSTTTATTTTTTETTTSTTPTTTTPTTTTPSTTTPTTTTPSTTTETTTPSTTTETTTPTTTPTTTTPTTTTAATSTTTKKREDDEPENKKED